MERMPKKRFPNDNGFSNGFRSYFENILLMLQMLLHHRVKHMGGSTPKWMVKIMENPIKMDDLGVPLFSETSI